MSEEKKEETASLDLKLLRKFARLDKLKSVLNAALDKVNAKLDPVREHVVDHMVDAGIPNIKISGRTVYLSNEIWPKRLGTPDEVTKALEESGLGEYVKKGYNHQSIGGYFREMVKNKEPIPPEVLKVIEPNFVTKVKSIKS